MLLQMYFLEKNISISDRVDQDQTARSVQSVLDLHCLQQTRQKRFLAPGFNGE